jgi:hypothetical protein
MGQIADKASAALFRSNELGPTGSINIDRETRAPAVAIRCWQGADYYFYTLGRSKSSIFPWSNSCSLVLVKRSGIAVCMCVRVCACASVFIVVLRCGCTGVCIQAPLETQRGGMR